KVGRCVKRGSGKGREGDSQHQAAGDLLIEGRPIADPNGSRRRRRDGDTGGKTESPTVTMERYIREKKLRGGEQGRGRGNNRKKTLVERNLGVLDLRADANADPIIEP